MREKVIELLLILVHVAVPMVAFAVGMDVAPAQVSWLWRQPRRLGRSLLVVLVGVPLAAALMVRAVPLAPAVAAGLLMIAISVGPVAALKRTRSSDDDRSYAVGLDLTLLMISIPFIPLAFAVLGAVFGRKVSIPPREVARVVLLLQLAPMALGLLVARQWPRFTARIAGPVTVIGNGLLALVALVVIVALAKPMLAIGGRGLLATAALAVAATVLGHVFGGPSPATRLTLAAFSSLRFPALALLLAAHVRLGSAAIMPVVAAYLLISLVVIILYRLLLVPGGRGATSAPPLGAPPAVAA
jgi:BASS family bile acid:Na+ symporter